MSKNRKTFLEKKSKSKKPIIIGVVASILVLGFVLAVLSSGTKSFTPVSEEAGLIKIPLSEIDQKAKFYTYKTGGGKVNFFILRSLDGEIRAALDACDVCWKEKKGYTQKGDYMICNNCGLEFPSNEINVVVGGCNPTPLRGSISEGYFVITKDDALRGEGYF